MADKINQLILIYLSAFFRRAIFSPHINLSVLILNTALHLRIHTQDGVEEDNWLEHNLAVYIHPIGSAAGGNDQTGSTHVEVWLLL